MPPGSAPPPTALRSLRIWYAVVQSVSYAVFVGLCFMARAFEAIFDQMEMRQLPLPTEISVAVSRFVRTPPGLVLVAVLGIALVVQGIRGKFDPRLRTMIRANVVGTMALIAFYILGLYLPIVHLQRAIEKAAP